MKILKTENGMTAQKYGWVPLIPVIIFETMTTGNI